VVLSIVHGAIAGAVVAVLAAVVAARRDPRLRHLGAVDTIETGSGDHVTILRAAIPRDAYRSGRRTARRTGPPDDVLFRRLAGEIAHYAPVPSGAEIRVESDDPRLAAFIAQGLRRAASDLSRVGAGAPAGRGADTPGDTWVVGAVTAQTRWRELGSLADRVREDGGRIVVVVP
jgi:hypothetical protein